MLQKDDIKTGHGSRCGVSRIRFAENLSHLNCMTGTNYLDWMQIPIKTMLEI